ncbi:MAG: class I SAM-dependent rRNA methyltransferase [Planctomycetes bacterium]|nr:class I SAM-dependent rRNA methyltransferase [Planctomycetota bacterium]
MRRAIASELRVELKLRRNSKHPWIYLKMCRPASHPPGSLVEVVDKDGAFVGRGIYNRKSQIAIRLLTENPNQPLDEAFFGKALDRAIGFRRRKLDLERITDAYRVVNAEGDGLSGLVVDRFASFVVVQLFSAGWFRLLRWLLPALEECFPDSTVLVKADDLVEEREGFHVQDFTAARLGDSRLRTIVHEGGLAFHVDLRHGHKTGFFCDQRENRLRVRDLARGLHVLDCFSYTGGFALNAAKGGAASVTAVDLDEKAIALARENAEANRLRVDFRHQDAFDALREARAAGRTYDLVILDPPKFAAGRTEIDAGLRRYRDVNELACGVVRDGGTLVTCSCSGAVSETRFREAVEAGAARASATLALVDSAGAAADHPLRPEFPEGRYLKVLTYVVRRGVTSHSPSRPREPR